MFQQCLAEPCPFSQAKAGSAALDHPLGRPKPCPPPRFHASGRSVRPRHRDPSGASRFWFSLASVAARRLAHLLHTDACAMLRPD